MSIPNIWKKHVPNHQPLAKNQQDGNLKNHRHKEEEQRRHGEEVVGVKVAGQEQENGAT